MFKSQIRTEKGRVSNERKEKKKKNFQYMVQAVNKDKMIEERKFC